MLAYGQVGSGGLVRELPQGPHILSIVWQVRNRLMHSPSPADRASRPITCSCSSLRVVMRRLLMRLHSTFVSFAVCVSLTALARLPPVDRQESAQRQCLTPQTLSSKRSLSASMSIVSASCKSCLKRLGAWASHPRLSPAPPSSLPARTALPSPPSLPERTARRGSFIASNVATCASGSFIAAVAACASGSYIAIFAACARGFFIAAACTCATLSPLSLPARTARSPLPLLLQLLDCTSARVLAGNATLACTSLTLSAVAPPLTLRLPNGTTTHTFAVLAAPAVAPPTLPSLPDLRSLRHRSWPFHKPCSGGTTGPSQPYRANWGMGCNGTEGITHSGYKPNSKSYDSNGPELCPLKVHESRPETKNVRHI